jgi:hypothetical protein
MCKVEKRLMEERHPWIRGEESSKFKIIHRTPTSECNDIDPSEMFSILGMSWPRRNLSTSDVPLRRNKESMPDEGNDNHSNEPFPKDDLTVLKNSSGTSLMRDTRRDPLTEHIGYDDRNHPLRSSTHTRVVVILLPAS